MIIDENFNFDDLSILNEKKIIIRNIKDIPFGLFMNSGIKEVIIEEGTESIGDYAFSRNNIETIVLPHSLKSIGDYAFSNNKLEHINFNDNLLSIKNKAFSNNPIKEVELPNSLSNIGLYVFPSDTIIMYDNKKFDVSLINQFDNFIETYKIIMKMIPDFDFNKVNINIVLMLCEKNDLIKLKSYWYNKNNFEIFNAILQGSFRHALDKNKHSMLLTCDDKPCGIMVNLNKTACHFVNYICTWPIEPDKKAPFGAQTLFEEMFKNFLNSQAKFIELYAIRFGDAISKYMRIGFTPRGGDNDVELMKISRAKVLESYKKLKERINLEPANNKEDIDLLKELKY